MLSARAGEESRVAGMQAGADDYLVKPFSARELLARVTAHLKMARMRREASGSLRQSGDRLRMALTSARMMAWEFDPSTGKLVLSENASDLLGLPAGVTLEQAEAGLAVLHPDDVPAHRAQVTQAIEECGSYTSQYRILRPDNGMMQWMEEWGHGVCDELNGPVRLVGVVMDITDRKRAEAAIRASEGRTRTILESITDGFFALDRNWHFTYINAAGERFLDRIIPGDLLGKSLWEEYPGTVGTEFEEVYRRVATNGVGESFTAYCKNFDRWYEVSAYPAPDGLSVYFRDVTEQKRIEDRLRASEERRRLAPRCG